MKIKSKFYYGLFKNFSRKFLKLFNRFYAHKLNYNLLYLLKENLKIEVVYDIGAFRGEWSSYLSKTSLNNKQFILFEANKENEEYLKNKEFKYFIELLSNEEKDLKFYSQVSTGDSYFLEQTTFYENRIEPQIIKAVTLDKLVSKNNIPLPDFIKIDTQGSELDILRGGEKTISNCSLIYLECPIIEYNMGSPNLSEYIEYLNLIDFIPYDICEVHKIDNVLIQIDILFIKKSIFKKIYPGEKVLNILNSS
jgi:FkbM family methyltransferase